MAKKSRYADYKNGIGKIQKSREGSPSATAEDYGQMVQVKKNAVSSERGNNSVLGKLKALRHEASAEAVKGSCE